MFKRKYVVLCVSTELDVEKLTHCPLSSIKQCSIKSWIGQNNCVKNQWYWFTTITTKCWCKQLEQHYGHDSNRFLCFTADDSNMTHEWRTGRRVSLTSAHLFICTDKFAAEFVPNGYLLSRIQPDWCLWWSWSTFQSVKPLRWISITLQKKK